MSNIEKRVASLIRSGYRRHLIIERLLQEGWSSDDIEEAFDTLYVSGSIPEEFWKKGVLSVGFSNVSPHSVSDVIDEKEKVSSSHRLKRFVSYHKKEVFVWSVLVGVCVIGLSVAFFFYINNPQVVLSRGYESLANASRLSFSFDGNVSFPLSLEGDVREYRSGFFTLSVERGSGWDGEVLVDERGLVFTRFSRGIADDVLSRWILLDDSYPGDERSLKNLGVYPVFSHMKFLFLLDGRLGDGVFSLFDQPGAFSVERFEEGDRGSIRAYHVSLSRLVVDELWRSLIGESEEFLYRIVEQGVWEVYIDGGKIVGAELRIDPYYLSFSFSYPEKRDPYQLDVEPIPVRDASEWVVIPQ